MVAVTAPIVLLTVAPASAAYYYSYDLYGPVPGYAGSGDLEGDIQYAVSARKKFTVFASIRDNCPADGKGMEMQMLVDTTGANWTKGNIVQDLDNCGNGWTTTGYPLDFTAPNPIVQARAQLWATEGGVPFVLVDQSNWKPHPEA